MWEAARDFISRSRSFQSDRGKIMGVIYFVEKNVRGAWVIYGQIGVKKYDGYTKQEAIKKYKEECKRTVIENE